MPSLPRSHRIVGRWVPSVGATGYRLVDRVRSNHGTLTNMDPASDWVASGGKLALDFDGSNDFVDASSPSVGSITTNATVSIWMTLSATGRTASLFGVNSTGGANQRFQAHAPWSDNNIYWDFGGTSAPNRLTVTGQSWPLNAWNHLVFIAGSIGMQVYRNGLLIGSSSTAATRSASSNQLIVGGSLLDNNPPYYHAGQIDDVTIFNTALTAPEVREIYRFGRGYGVFPEPDFDEGFAAAGFKAYWARRQSQLIGGGV
jgi:hypothetical protein